VTSVVFMGTPSSAVPTLQLLAGQCEVRAVITRPDRPKGRSGAPEPPPVKAAAREMGLEVIQPGSRLELDASLAGLSPYQVGVVVAFGQILSGQAISVAEVGNLNVHFSLLPRWRGAAPVAHAIMAGDEMTGVTIIEIDDGLDTGGVLTAQAIDIRPGENAGQLTDRLASVGARLVVSVVDGYAGGSLTPVPQVDEGMTYASKLEPADRELRVEMGADEFVNRVRGLAPRPGAHLTLDGVRTRILDAAVARDDVDPGRWELIDSKPLVGLARGSVELRMLQPAGKRAMTGVEWGRGRKTSRGRVGG
jgi:methionyl-tRNA formyltransferase